MSLPFATRLGLAAAIGSIALLGGAYYFQYVVGLAPCDMCLWQRYPHMIAILFGLITIPLMVEPKVALVFALTAIAALFVTSGIGVFHVGVEQHWWAGPTTCTAPEPGAQSSGELLDQILATPVVLCDQVAWSLWGISMAGWSAILSLGLAWLWLRAAAAASD